MTWKGEEKPYSLGCCLCLFLGSCCPCLEGRYWGEMIFFYPCKMTPFIERCISSTKPNGRFSVLIINKFSLWLPLRLSSASTCPKWPLFQIYHLFLTENFSFPSQAAEKLHLHRSNRDWEDQRVTKKVVIRCLRSKLALPKNPAYIIAEQCDLFFDFFPYSKKKKIYWWYWKT